MPDNHRSPLRTPEQMLCKGVETPLVQVPPTDRVVRHVPTHGVGVRQGAKVGRDLAFLSRPHDEVPVIPHHTPGQQPRRTPRLRLGHDSLDPLVVLLLAKQRQSRH
jgi:hypothetical protein